MLTSLLLYSNFPSLMPNSGQKLISITYSEKRIGMKTNVYRVLMGKPEGKRPLGRLRCRQ